MKKPARLISFILLLLLPLSLFAESMDYIGVSIGGDFSSKTKVFYDGNAWESNRASVDLMMDLLVYFNSANSHIRFGTGFSIGCGFPVYYVTGFGSIEGKKPIAFYGKASAEMACFFNDKTAIEQKIGFAIRVDQLDFRKNYSEVGLSAPTKVMNSSIMGLWGASVRHEVAAGVVVRGGVEMSFSILEYLDSFQGPAVINKYMGMYRGSRYSCMPYISLLFSY